ncbi:MAG: alpha/beta hydrolase, partial [Ruminococcaceae bacterium]|nr:alpha/beta hydrolase [Oscillospiraceae bacterium]
MRFHTFGDKNNRAIVLIHGVLTPWQMWEYQIERLKDEFYVIVPALDGHTEEEASQFVSVEKEAEQIEDYILENLGGQVYAVCGISMGGVISSIIWKNRRVKISRLVMDGAPLARLPR